MSAVRLVLPPGILRDLTIRIPPAEPPVEPEVEVVLRSNTPTSAVVAATLATTQVYELARLIRAWRAEHHRSDPDDDVRLTITERGFEDMLVVPPVVRHAEVVEALVRLTDAWSTEDA